MSTKHFYRRRFLNRRGFHAGAYVLASCTIEAFRPKGARATYSVDAVFTVADCGRVATLDFSVHNEATARNAVYKANELRRAIDDFTAALEGGIEEWRARQQ
jgi:hypothetical protein